MCLTADKRSTLDFVKELKKSKEITCWKIYKVAKNANGNERLFAPIRHGKVNFVGNRIVSNREGDYRKLKWGRTFWFWGDNVSDICKGIHVFKNKNTGCVRCYGDDCIKIPVKCKIEHFVGCDQHKKYLVFTEVSVSNDIMKKYSK